MDEGRESGPDGHVDGGHLAALLDDELSPAERRTIERHVAVCPRCAVALELQRRARTALRGAAARMEAPPSLRSQVEARLSTASVRRPGRRRVLLAAAIAAALALAVMSGLLVLAARGAPSRQVLARVANAHEQALAGAAPVAFAANDPNAVQAWLRPHTGETVDVPDLGAAGYQLVGARRDPEIAPRAVTIVYQGPGGLLSCVVLPSTPPAWTRAPLSLLHPGVETASVAHTQLASWVTSYGTYVLAGDLRPAELALLAHIAAKPDRNS